MLESVFTFLFKYRPLVFRQGHLAFSPPLPALVLVVVALVLAAFLVWTYVRVRGKTGVRDRTILLALRLAVLAVLVFALFRPALVLSTVVPQQNYLGILVDDSRSMRIADTGSPRSDFVQRDFGPESLLIKQLAARFRLRFFRFSSGADRVGDLSQLTYAGDRTEIAPALDRVRQELSPEPVSGFVLVSDGADNAPGTLTESLLALKAAGIPVFTVGVGRAAYDHDIELSRVATPRQVLKGSSLVVDLMVSQHGYAGREVPLYVEDGGTILNSQQVRLPADGEPTTVRVHFTADEVGPRRFRFRIPPQPGELVPENNVQEALIDVRDDREKVLYFEGEPRFEMKFIRRAVQEDQNLQLVVLQRTAENKYLRLEVDSANQLVGGFPRTRDELFKYRGLILGSIEASYFSHDQLNMIADFVSERGGGLLMLGGRRSFGEGGWAGTPVADVLPIDLAEQDAGDTTFFAELKVSPTRAGLAHVITQLAPTEEESAKRWPELPALSTFNHVRGLKPGATALLVGEGPDLPNGQPVLVQQRYGRGNVLAFAVQDSWMWQMSDSVSVEDMTFETFWRQLLRWLVSTVPEQVTVNLPTDRVMPGEAVRIGAEVDDDNYLKLNSSRVTAHVKAPSGAVQDVPLEWTVDRDGAYAGSFTPTELGVYAITVDATTAGHTLSSEPAYLNAAEGTGEYFGSQLHPALLKRVAEETGGRYYTPADVASLPEDVSFAGKGATVVEEKDLWDMPLIFLLLLLLVSSEWAYRRWRGLV